MLKKKTEQAFQAEKSLNILTTGQPQLENKKKMIYTKFLTITNSNHKYLKFNKESNIWPRTFQLLKEFQNAASRRQLEQ